MKREYNISFSTTNDQRGIALPLVLMVMLVFTILGAAAWNASQSSLKQAALLRPQLQAEYLARSAVDATIAAWTDKWIKQSTENPLPTSAHFFTRYDENSDEFVEANASESGQDNVIETTQTYNPTTGICTIISSAAIGSSSATVKAVSEPVHNVASTTSLWVQNDTIQPNTDPAFNHVDTAKGYNYYSSYHFSDGIVTVKTSKPNNTLYLDHDTVYNGHKVNLIGYQAKKIIYECPLDLFWRTWYLFPDYTRVYGHVVTAEHIVFKKDIIIGDGRYGTLILNLPDGKGIPGQVIYQQVKANKVDREKVDLNAMYGIVKFAKVTVEGSLFDENSDKNIKNRTFYFREPAGEKSLIIGMEPNALSDLADWLGITNSNRDYRLEKLLEKGYFIPAPNNGIGNNVGENDYQIRFIYE